MLFEPGTPPAYVMAIMLVAVMALFFFGVGGALLGGIFYDAGYTKIHPFEIGRLAGGTAAIIALVIGSVTSYRDYRFTPKSTLEKGAENADQ